MNHSRSVLPAGCGAEMHTLTAPINTTQAAKRGVKTWWFLALTVWGEGSEAWQGNFRVIPFDTNHCTSTPSHMACPGLASQRADEGIWCKRVGARGHFSGQTHARRLLLVFYTIYRSSVTWIKYTPSLFSSSLVIACDTLPSAKGKK